jgi:galactokinase
VNQLVLDRVLKKFSELTSHNPVTIFSPGRINLIGEHTDYNEGFVMPAAVNLGIYFAIAPRKDQTIHLHAVDLEDTYITTLSELTPLVPNQWPNYVLGVVSELVNARYDFTGFDLVFGGDIPVGAGMSSSAALENGVAFALNELYDLGMGKMEMLQHAQLAEHHFAGVKCGIMDQFASMMGQKDHVMLLDCRSIDASYHPLSLAGYELLLINSNVSHELVSSAYNERRSQCEEAVSVIAERHPDIKSLRDVSPEVLESHKSALDPLEYQRSRYVLQENERVQAMANALQNGDAARIGQLLNQGQDGIRYDYEITCKETDFLADWSRDQSYILGCRQMGGGFGGCLVVLIRGEHKRSYVEELNQAYAKAFGQEITAIDVSPDDGTRLL